VRYEVLGDLRVLDTNGVDVTPSAPKLRTLLAVLLVNRGRPVTVDRIADVLWDDGPPRSAPNLVSDFSERDPLRGSGDDHELVCTSRCRTTVDPRPPGDVIRG
jgi:hypothetical protein